jgi:hypothetical protein
MCTRDTLLCVPCVASCTEPKIVWMPDAVAALTLSRTHIALMKPAYLRSVLAGTKCVECRLSLTKRVPLCTRAAWDTLFLVATGGGQACTATCSRVMTFEHLSPSGVARLAKLYNQAIRAPREFWRAKSRARFATLVWLAHVREVHAWPDYRSIPGAAPRSAWIVVPRSLCPAPLKVSAHAHCEGFIAPHERSFQEQRKRGALLHPS